MARYVPKHLAARRHRRRRSRSLLTVWVASVFVLLVACQAFGTADPAPVSAAAPVILSTPTFAPAPSPSPSPSPPPALERTKWTEEDPGPVYLYLPEVPLDADLQRDMQVACEEYRVPFALALGVADLETGGLFNMDAVGACGEVGIMQLNPGPNSTYHAELQRDTGWDPTTPTGNIYCGCYLLGKYIDAYDGDWHKTLMAYNCGVSSAKQQWAKGYTSSGYSRAVIDNVEKWQSEIDKLTNDKGGNSQW